jgi:diaminopimelate epimerase
MNDMQVPFIKMHGSGNIILVVDQRKDNRAPPKVHQLRDLANNEPGFDQLMWISPADDGASVASYRVFNADGSEVQQCGNGVRCVAKYLVGLPDLGLKHGQDFSLQSPAGGVIARVHHDGQVAVSMGAPIFKPADIPFTYSETAETYPLPVGEGHIEICALSMGNPHAVLDVDDVKEAPVADLGPVIEHHAWFPELANVGFMHITDRHNIELRVHERGVGETAACGTGACAAVVSGQRRGKLDEEVQVHLPGGKVVVSWRGGDAPVWLQGNAELITEGMIDLQE